MGKKMIHITLEVGNVERYVFPPGSPECMEKIVAYFSDPQEIAYGREYRTFVDELGGVRVAVASTGTGNPSAAIVVKEPHQCGAGAMMRVGTCTPVSLKVSLGDVVIPNGVVKMEGVSLHYLPVEFPSMPDFHMLKYIEQAARNLGYPYNVGVTITEASSYTRAEPGTRPAGPEFMFKWPVYEKGGATSTSMEYAPLLAINSCLGIRTACMMASATNCRNYSDDGRNTKINIENRAIQTTIEAMGIIIGNDKEMKQLMDYEETPLLKGMNIPHYIQIYGVTYQLIRENVLQEGDTLPRENILAEYQNVSHSTVRTVVWEPEEDGYTYKMQGKKTMVTGQLARNKGRLQHTSGPCISNCIDTVIKAEAVISMQDDGRLTRDLLGYNGKVFTAMAVDMKYHVEETYVAFSVAIIPMLHLKQGGVAINEEGGLKDLVLSGLYKCAGRFSLPASAAEWTEEATDQPQSPAVIVMDKMLYEGEAPLVCHKYRMDSG